MTAIEKIEQALTKSADMLAIQGKKLCETEGVLILLRMMASSCKELSAEEKSKPVPVEEKATKCQYWEMGAFAPKCFNPGQENPDGFECPKGTDGECNIVQVKATGEASLWEECPQEGQECGPEMCDGTYTKYDGICIRPYRPASPAVEGLVREMQEWKKAYDVFPSMANDRLFDEILAKYDNAKGGK